MNELSRRRFIAPLVLLALICTAKLSAASSTAASSSPMPQTDRLAPGECDRERALDLVQQQIAEIKLIDDEVARISLLLRVADLVWLSEQQTARSLFTEAYELAARNYKQNGEVIRQEDSGLASLVPDQRFVVIRAVARRDAAWAKKLTQSALEETEREAGKASDSATRERNPGEKLIEVAFSLLPEHKEMALELARESLPYPATNGLPHFLFQLAATDRKSADQFFLEALSTYAREGVGELLSLAAYPFGLNRAAGQDANSVWYSVPPQYVPHALLERAFLEQLFERARQIAQSPARPPVDAYSLPDAARIYLALSKLEPFISRDQPALAQRASEIKELLGALLTAETRQAVAREWREQQEIDQRALSDFTDQIDREKNPERRDLLIVHAIQAGSETESLERLEDLARTVTDSKVRDQLLNWLYFNQAQRAAREGSLDEAARLAKKVAELDQRAYLFFEIAEASVKQFKESARARETLGEVAEMARKAPQTAEKARTLLGITSLYIKYDPSRAFEAMGEALRTINRIPEQDFTRAYVVQKIEGPKWTTYFSFNFTSFSLENTFRELGQKDFDLALDLARGLEQRALRVTAVIALAAPCLEKPQKKEPARKPKSRGPRSP